MFNLKTDSVGIYNSYLSKADNKLLKETNYYKDISNKRILTGQTLLYKLKVIEEEKINKLFLYSRTAKYKSSIQKFGKYLDECLEYYYYHFKTDSILKNDKEYLFASPYDLDLIYTKNKKIDSLINSRYVDVCYDCPTSWNTQETFAKLKGYDDLYFSYVLSKRKNNKSTYTPMRAFHYVNNSLVITLWSSSVDLFGCSCL